MTSKRSSIRTIPPEIITEISYRLPSRSVGQFRCVSKGWLSLLTDPQFIKTHQNTLKQHHFIFASTSTALYSHPFDHHEAVMNPTTKLKLKLGYDVGKCFHRYQFGASCNGLILVSFVYFDNPEILAVLNPTTSELVDLPDFEYVSEIKRPLRGPYYRIYIYGLGYDSVTDDYKVVIISYDLMAQSRLNHASVYSLRNKTWRRVADYPYAYNKFPGVCANGFIHWIGRKIDTDNSHVIVAFSLADEYFTEVPSPIFGNDLDIMSKMGCRPVVLDGKLAIYYDSEVWLMNEYGVKESWTKIPLDKFGKVQVPETLIFKDGKIRVGRVDRMLIYNVEKGNFNKTVSFPDPTNFVENLVSPKYSINNYKCTNSRRYMH